MDQISTPEEEDVMAKKKLKKKVQRRGSASKLSEPVVQSAREVWLAGLGALNIAQQEGGKIIERGSKLFDKLVEEGGKFESRTRSDIEGAVSDLKNEVENRMSGVKQRTDSVRKQAADNWDKLERIFEERVARALASLGIPTREDIKGLSVRVQDLAEQVRELDSGKPRAPAAKPSTKTAARKPAKKKAKKKAVKKTVVKKSGSGKS
jgi:poly(hydroxyalkanoate) granule-associated protein